ncbi:hypothetical protein AB0J72_30655 [Dactylosporangium sp. NPDC049742]|uniref:hypothetical protein n=1 Tax=Dactylosporangium sp. NPDC049742 TaxID=3154737 RepID=UPI0034343A17
MQQKIKANVTAVTLALIFGLFGGGPAPVRRGLAVEQLAGHDDALDLVGSLVDRDLADLLLGGGPVRAQGSGPRLGGRPRRDGRLGVTAG